MTEYIFHENETDLELRRLRRIEAALDGHSRALIERTGPAPRWQCLEVGAGAGSILRWLGGRVGPEGRAVGVDKSATYLSAFTNPPFEVVEADVRDFTSAASFDLIHARYVLIHNRDAATLLNHLAGLLKPGGHLVLEEPDFQSAEWLDPRYRRAGERVNCAICAMFKALSLDPGFGKRMPLLLSDAGVAIRHVESRTHLEPGGAPIALMMADSAQALREKYIATGQASSQDIDRYTEGAQDFSSWAIYYSTVSIVAIKR